VVAVRGNSQPWSFVLALRGDCTHQAMTISAFGRPAEGSEPPERDRRPPHDLVWPPEAPDADLGGTGAR
jgi:hypothetical protein